MSASVLVIREPDSPTDVIAVGDVLVYTVDLGSSFDGLKYIVRDLGEDGAREWIADLRTSVRDAPAEIRTHVDTIINDAEEVLRAAL